MASVGAVSSQRYVALLRAVNLGARNKVSMKDLRALCEELGLEDVTTYVQSGNVVFTSAAGSETEAAAQIERELDSCLGLTVTVLVRSGEQLAEIVAANPFRDRGSEPTRLHVTFLAAAPADDAVGELAAESFEPDEFEVVGREVYLHCPGGYGKSKLSNAYFERKLGVVGTTRNWRTVTTLAELAQA
jgi:uncharacterized protein (DUF1697 family)